MIMGGRVSEFQNQFGVFLHLHGEFQPANAGTAMAGESSPI